MTTALNTLNPLNPLTMPLLGLQVIEASAGTGKTWTLAALYVRLVLGHVPGTKVLGDGLYPPQILVMTFTEAATAELRGRIRERLSQAARFFRYGDQVGVDADIFLQTLRSEIDPVLWPTCAYRLDMAAQWMDDAAIFTIHGWSSRMLKTHAFDSSSLFQQSRVEDSDQLKLSAVQDYWRKWFYPLSLSQLDALKPLGNTPQELFQKLGELWTLEDQAPNQRVEVAQTPDQVIRDWEVWQTQLTALENQARAACTDDIVGLLNNAIEAKKLKSYRMDWPGKLAEWAKGGAFAGLKKKERDNALKVLERFSLRLLLEKGWHDASGHLAFAHLEAFADHIGQEPEIGTLLLAHAAFEVGAAYRKAKVQLAQFDFSDLLQHLHEALQAPDGRLAIAIRCQFPVALVDEFQDTDPWQYGALSKIYGEAVPVDVPQSTGLIMIGDPKQAIYSFRGADLNTYLMARQQAQAIHTLSGNFRSTAGVVAAVNHVFSRVPKPFGDVPFEPVVACNAKVQPLHIHGQVQAAMTVWHLQHAKPPRKEVFVQQMAALFATQMVRLLNLGAAEPGNMAVLVRDGTEARAVRRALADRGVRSVYLSERDSVFATPAATDVWRILRAVAQPRNTAFVRAALATPLWGMAWPELEALFQNEQAWDDLTDRFHSWQKIWQRQGFLPMLHHLLHDQSIPARLLNQGGGHSTDSAVNTDNTGKPDRTVNQGYNGERQLTNLLHLGDLLQAASLGLQGEEALIRYLEDQLRRPQSSGDKAQLRLESDADLVQVITLHKAKGLQYPLVFLPFVSNYRAEKADSDKDDALRLAEDIRLLYVALTRAEQALWVGVAATKGDVDGKTPKVKNAVSLLLGRQAVGDLGTCLKGWAESEHIVVQTAPEPEATRYVAAPSDKLWRPALTPQRLHTSRWWAASFSALARGVGQRTSPHLTVSVTPGSEQDERIDDAQIDSTQIDNAQAQDALSASLGVNALSAVSASPTAPLPFNAFKAGSAYGTLVHELLEWQAHRGWPAARNVSNTSNINSTTATAEWQAVVARKAQRLNLDEATCALLVTWVQAIATAHLPMPHNTGVMPHEPVALVLGALDADSYWAEMAFTLPVHQLGAEKIDHLIQQHVLPKQAREALFSRQLEGMLTGFIDGVLLFEGRYYVLDYKSNKLPAYSPAHLQQAILAHRYDVQYTLYLLALHRLLKSRLPDYNYDQHVGGALYLFLRGIDQPGAGLYVDLPPKALIEALDTAFSAKHHLTATSEVAP